MRRMTATARPDWRAIVESQGLAFHTLDDGVTPYWDESAYYLFTRREIDELERATNELDRLCLQAVDHVLENDLLERFDIASQWGDWLRTSWQRDEQTLVGRFDLVYDGLGPPKMLEYNADTPTSLLEAAVIQWYWFRDQLAGRDPQASGLDQFNSLHERLIEAWRRIGREVSGGVHLASLGREESLEDFLTAGYLRDTAMQAGLRTRQLEVAEIGWNTALRTFVDLGEQPIHAVFKLYPWEWLLDEPFAEHLAESPTRWLEPPWKMILSNKHLLPLLWELFPECPYLLRAEYQPWGDTYVRKPAFSREGAGVTIVSQGHCLADAGDEHPGPFIYQEYCGLPTHAGRSLVIGSWMINGYAAGIGIRESAGPITDNRSHFVPHLFSN